MPSAWSVPQPPIRFVQIAGVAMVRNEADVIEAFVRHHASRLDVLYVVDHCSQDGTREILAALAAEGVQLTVAHDDQPAQRQSRIITALARQAFSQGAAIVLPLDADEFVKWPQRAAFERWLDALPAGLCAALDWQTYVPEAFAGTGHPLARARRRRAIEAHGLHKVVLTRAFAEAPAAVVGPGSHAVLFDGADQDLARRPVRLARVPAALAALAHLPVRSASQLCTKIALGWRAHQAASHDDATLAYHWQALYEELARTGPPGDIRLREIAMNYGVPSHAWRATGDIALIDDPLPAGTPIRHAARACAVAVAF